MKSHRNASVWKRYHPRKYLLVGLPMFLCPIALITFGLIASAHNGKIPTNVAPWLLPILAGSIIMPFVIAMTVSYAIRPYLLKKRVPESDDEFLQGISEKIGAGGIDESLSRSSLACRRALAKLYDVDYQLVSYLDDCYSLDWIRPWFSDDLSEYYSVVLKDLHEDTSPSHSIESFQSKIAAGSATVSDLCSATWDYYRGVEMSRKLLDDNAVQNENYER